MILHPILNYESIIIIFFIKENLERLPSKYKNSCFSGWVLMSSHLIKHFPTGKYNFEDMFENLQIKIVINSKTLQTNSFIYDFGTPNRYKQLSIF